MSVPLSDFLASLSIAVQRANEAIDAFAAESYLRQGFEKQDTPAEAESYLRQGFEKQNTPAEQLKPRTVSIALPGEGGDALNIPVSALMNHQTLRLDEVGMTLKISLREGDDDEPLVILNPEATDNVSEISLRFKSNPPAEGTARMQDYHIRSAFL